MAEEQTKTGEENQEEQTVEQPEQNENWRKHPGAMAVFKQLKVAQEKLAEIDAAKARAEKEAEIKRAQEAGKAEEMIKRLQEEKEQVVKNYEKQLLDSKLQAAFFQANATNSLFVKGAIVDFKGGADDIAEYVKAIADDPANASYFLKPDSSGNNAPPRVTPTSRTQKTDWTQVKAWETSGTQKEKAQAAELLEAHFREHGKFPY